jgi:hypothetical protein
MTPALRWFVFLWFVGYALCAASCAHRYQRHQTAYLEESSRIKWDSVEEKHEETQQQREQQRNDQQVVVRRKTTPSPAGPIVEEEYVLTLSELRDTSGVVTASGSRLAIEGEKEKAKKLENKLDVQADTRVGWPSPLWLLLLVPVAVGGWALRKWLRARIPFLG